MSRWCDRSIHDPGHSDETCGPLEVARLFGTLVAETILASVHVRAHRQAGHMDASDLIKALQNTLRGGGRPHKVSGYIPFSFPGLLLSQGSSMRSRRSAAPTRCSAISAATPTASPSPTVAWSDWRTARSASPGRTTARTAAPRGHDKSSA